MTLEKLCKLSHAHLAEVFKQFLSVVRNKEGNYYFNKTIFGYMCALQRYFNEKWRLEYNALPPSKKEKSSMRYLTWYSTKITEKNEHIQRHDLQ